MCMYIRLYTYMYGIPQIRIHVHGLITAKLTYMYMCHVHICITMIISMCISHVPCTCTYNCIIIIIRNTYITLPIM